VVFLRNRVQVTGLGGGGFAVPSSMKEGLSMYIAKLSPPLNHPVSNIYHSFFFISSMPWVGCRVVIEGERVGNVGLGEMGRLKISKPADWIYIDNQFYTSKPSRNVY